MSKVFGFHRREIHGGVLHNVYFILLEHRFITSFLNIEIRRRFPPHLPSCPKLPRASKSTNSSRMLVGVSSRKVTSLPTSALNQPSLSRNPNLTHLGDDFEKTSTGFVDFLLLDEKGFPLVVLEAKSEDKEPLVGKEQARTYAKSLNCRFVILSNGNLHYFWDLQRGNPNQITSFPTQDSVGHYSKFEPRSQASGRQTGWRRLHRTLPATELPVGSGIPERERAKRIYQASQTALSPNISTQGCARPPESCQ